MYNRSENAMLASLLRQAIAAIITLPHPGHMLEGDEFRKWLDSAGIIHGLISGSTGAAIGFNKEGMVKVAELSRHVRASRPCYVRGVSASTFIKQVADIVAGGFEDFSSASIGDEHVTAFEDVIESWFQKMAVQRRHFVPCAITPTAARAILVGPVTFVHASELSSHPLSVPQGGFVDELTLDLMRQAMEERAAAWVAIVDVDNCEESRSSELADLAIDIAVGTLQLIIHPDMSQRMARITARTSPPWRGSFVMTNSQFSGGVHNLQPGRTLFGEDLDAMAEKAKSLLIAAGRCLNVFLTGEGPLPKLRLAWCDAAYWFHEGLAEPLDSLAVAKLETAVEVLLRSGSSKGSKRRMEQAIRALTGLNPDDLVSNHSVLTVGQFAKALVGARSQVLHGTISTLMGELASERLDLTVLVHSLLVQFAIYLEGYAQDTVPSDDIEAFLGWMTRKREEVGQSSYGKSEYA
jgi:hypothetical protein